jgi:hypothetical protein
MGAASTRRHRGLCVRSAPFWTLCCGGLDRIAPMETAESTNPLSAALDRIVGECFVLSDSGFVAREGLEEEADASRQALTNTRQLIDEWVRCVNADSRLAATILGCAGLEGLLILGCLGRKEHVLTSRAWHRHAKKTRSYVGNVSHTDLGVLVAIGTELQWFKLETVPDIVMSLLPGIDLKELTRLLNEASSASSLFPAYARIIRNHLHVGKCLRTKANLDTAFSDAGFATSTLAIMSFLACFWFDATKAT